MRKKSNSGFKSRFNREPEIHKQHPKKEIEIYVLIGFVVGALAGVLVTQAISTFFGAGYTFKDIICSAYLYDVSVRRLSGEPPYPCSLSCETEPVSYCPGEAAIRLSIIRAVGPSIDAEQAFAFLDSLYVRMLKGETISDLPQISGYGSIEVNIPCAVGILKSLAEKGDVDVVGGLSECVYTVS